MTYQIILSDSQAIFRAGAARLLAVEHDMRIVAQFDDPHRFVASIKNFRPSIIILALDMQFDRMEVFRRMEAAGCRAILIAERNDDVLLDPPPSLLLEVVNRDIKGPDLVSAVRRVGSGQRSLRHLHVTARDEADPVGGRVLSRLSLKEMQILALILQGRKNKEIATQLHTKEQVIKNYLRNIFEKTGVCDRLQLALFTIHHRTLADAAERMASHLE